MMISMKDSLWLIDKKKSIFSDFFEDEDLESRFNGYLNRLKYLINEERFTDPYDGLRIVKVTFKDPYLRCAETDLISLLIMRLLIKYAYNTGFEYGKFTIGYIIKMPNNQIPKEDVSFTIGSAISLNDSSGNGVPNMDVYNKINQLIMKKAEDYDQELLSGIFIRLYMVGMQEKLLSISESEIDAQLWKLIHSSTVGGEPQEVKDMDRKKRKYTNHIPALKPSGKKSLPFIVADMETILKENMETTLKENVHVPYAAGFLVVKPGDDVGAKPDYEIETYFSEDYKPVIPDFKERSNKMLFDFLERLAVVTGQTKIRTVYFHNLSRFDGILLLKYYTSHCGDKYKIKPLMRNYMLYEISVYLGKKRVFRLRDSYTLLPSSLETLSKTLCPQLGSKGSIQHDEVNEFNLMKLKAELLDYMQQDIRLLGGVMLKAQDIYWTQYKVDIENCMTLSTLAMTIYRTSYYDENSWPIHIPSMNEDTFIRRGYYGGHTDVYKPYGENLYYYDVNSLYPYIMKTYPMPGGVPVWHGNLEDQELSNLYGFIEAYVECPSTITRPFLPYRVDNVSLVFPTGEFVGVYFSEELIFARDLGYKIIPLKGYLFEKKPSPFDSFVSSLFGRRQEAKKTGNEAMAYGYKILMNSLYGRFGINPKSTITEVCSRERYDYLTHNKNFVTADKLSDSYYIVSYIHNMGNVDPLEWNPPKVSAVQLSAAITACARIHMYKYISRPDCYYTDTDSAILGSPLPEEEISSIELGKLKIEHFVKKAIFLAPKSYILYTEEGSNIIKHKGAAKEHVDPEWFESQYADLSRTEHVKGVSTFQINWHNLHITKREYQVKLGIQLGTKRLPVFDNNNIWVDTQPKVVIDFGGQESSILKLMLKILQEQYDKILKEYEERIDKKEKEYEERIASIRKEYDKKREEMISRFAKLPEEPVMSPLTESPTGLEQPTGTKKPKKQKKGTKKQKKGTKKPKKGTKKPKKGTKKPKGPNDTS